MLRKRTQLVDDGAAALSASGRHNRGIFLLHGLANLELDAHEGAKMGVPPIDENIDGLVELRVAVERGYTRARAEPVPQQRAGAIDLALGRHDHCELSLAASDDLRNSSVGRHAWRPAGCPPMPNRLPCEDGPHEVDVPLISRSAARAGRWRRFSSAPAQTMDGEER